MIGQWPGVVFVQEGGKAKDEEAVRTVLVDRFHCWWWQQKLTDIMEPRASQQGRPPLDPHQRNKSTSLPLQERNNFMEYLLQRRTVREQGQE